MGRTNPGQGALYVAGSAMFVVLILSQFYTSGWVRLVALAVYGLAGVTLLMAARRFGRSDARDSSPDTESLHREDRE